MDFSKYTFLQPYADFYSKIVIVTLLLYKKCAIAVKCYLFIIK